MSLVAIAGQTFRLRVELESQSAAGTFQSSPTVAAGDVKLLILPASPAGTETYANSTNAPTLLNGPTAEVIIAAAETTAAGDGGEIIAVWADAAGDEWYSLSVHIQVKAAEIATEGAEMDLVDAPNATAVTAIQAGLAATGADGDTLKTLSDQIDGVPTTADNATAAAAAVWAYTPRTLTQTAAAVASVMAGTSLTITRGDTLSATLTGLGNITGYANLWFTVKWATSDLDAAAIIQIDTDTGLLTVNGAAATAGNGSITVDDATAGDITIALEASVTDDLTPATGLVYDVQWQSGTSIYTLTSGVAVVSADVTRAVA